MGYKGRVTPGSQPRRRVTYQSGYRLRNRDLFMEGRREVPNRGSHAAEPR